MLYVCADESHDEQRQHVLSMAGLLASRKAWDDWAEAWQGTLNKENVSVFHAADCDAGYGEFDGWDRARIEALQERLIAITVLSNVWGYSVSIPIDPHQSLRSRIRRLIRFDRRSAVNGPLDDPWFMCVQLLPVTVCEDPWTAQLPPHEQIGFVFDQHHLAARGRAIYLSVAKTERYRNRLAGVAFKDKAKIKSLQAADLLAYETFRRFHDAPDRWQYKALSSIVRAAAFVEQATLEEMVSKAEAIGRAAK